MTTFIRIGKLILNPDAISHVELMESTNEVNVYMISGFVIRLNTDRFLRIYNAFNAEGLIKDRTSIGGDKP